MFGAYRVGVEFMKGANDDLFCNFIYCFAFFRDEITFCAYGAGVEVMKLKPK